MPMKLRAAPLVRLLAALLALPLAACDSALPEAGADVNAKSDEGVTALMDAAAE